jgi:hypothetical protein
MESKVIVKNREIDFKSLLIGFLLATVFFLSIGAYGGSGTQDVRIVDINTSDNLNVKIDEVDSYITLPVKIKDVDSYTVIPVKIKDQPITVTTR